MTQRWFDSSKRTGWLAGAAAGASVVLAPFVIHTDEAHSQDSQDAVVVPPAVPGVGPGSFADVVEAVSPAVVNISVSKVERAAPTMGFNSRQFNERFGNQMPGFDEFLERFFGGMPGGSPAPRERRSEGAGSGFVIDAGGFVVTNNHVIDGADKITVTFQDGRKLDAQLVGTDPKTDLALIKVEASGLPFVHLGDSDGARVGDWVVAIGNPFGLGGTATAGIVSARGRDIQSGPYDDYLQIDAPINFGNSGGPVFDVGGRVVGVTTAIYSPNGGSVGIGFAIPANQAKSVLAELKADGTVARGWLGVQIQNLDEELAASLGVKETKGALIAEVLGDGPAAKAGLQAGDVVTHFDGHVIDTARTLSRVVGDADPNDRAKVTVLRDGKSRDITVTLGEADASTPAVAGRSGAPSADKGALGLSLQPLTDELREELGLPRGTAGVLVANVVPDSPAAAKGIRPGDVITRIDGKDVTGVDEAVAAFEAARNDDGRALVLVKRGDSQRFVALSFS